MRVLNRKLLRDLFQMRWQVVTIALVVASGVSALVSIRGTYASLVRARDSYYERERLGDVFAHCERAPRSIVARLEAIPGVAKVMPRIVRRGLLPLEDLPEPASAVLVSIPDDGPPPLVGIVLVDGRLPDATRTDEALVLESFARNRSLGPGDSVRVVMNGVLRELRVAGVAMSPEYVMAGDASAPGAEDKFAVLWMRERVLAGVYELEGAFDDVVIATTPDANELEVLARVDRELEPYGGAGAIPRRRMMSAYVVDQELSQLEGMATTVPLLFLGVAAFLLHVALSRLVELQRGQVAVLRALGYGAWEVGGHYLGFASTISLLGGGLGIAGGAAMGRAYTNLYLYYFRFPNESFRLDPGLVAVGLLVSLGAGVLGGLTTVRRVSRLPPADAMRPAAPEVYRAGPLSRLGLTRLVEMAGKMVIRETERRPGRLVLSALGIAMSVSILVVGRFMGDATEMLMQTLFERAMREDLAVMFVSPAPAESISELAHLPGVSLAEGVRQLTVRVRVGHAHRDVTFEAHRPGLRLRRILDETSREHEVPEDGVLVTAKLAEVLGIRPGDDIDVEVLSGERRRGPLRVAGLVTDMYGLNLHASDETLRRFLREDPRIDVALLRVDPRELPEVRKRLARYAGVGGVLRRPAMVQAFRERSGQIMGVMTVMLTFFASVISVGVVYNNARVALSMRSRDLATLRVLGFTRREVGGVLFGEIVAQLLLGIPIGLWLGDLFSWAMMRTVDAERYRWPVYVSDATHAFAIVVVCATTMVTWAVFRERLRKLDLIAVLKTRE